MQFKFPDVGEGIHEAKIVHINVKSGDHIKKDDVICEVETDKSVVEIPAPFDGVIKEIPHQIGDEIKVGDTLLEYETEQATNKQTVNEETPKKEGNVVGSLDDADDTNFDLDFSNYEANKSAAPEKTLDRASLEKTSIEEPSEIKTDKEITTYQNSSIEELSSTRKAIAKNMRETKSNSVTVTHFDEIICDSIIEKREALKKAGIKVSYLSLIIEAYCKTLKEFPKFNATYHQTDEKLEIFKDINMAVAVDSEKGLMVPVIKNCENLNAEGINEAIIELANKAKEGKLQISDMQNSTVCITNYGSIGGKFATPVLNPGNLINLGIGRMEEKICFHDNHLHSHPYIPVSLSYDHQIIDGADAARFLNKLGEFIDLEN